MTTTKDIRNGYLRYKITDSETLPTKSEIRQWIGEFDRWLRERDAEKWDEGNEDAWCSGELAENPYRTKEEGSL